MLSTIRQAILSTQLDEGRLTPLMVITSHSAAPAALGIVIADVVSTIRRDRRELRRWLCDSGEALV